MRINIDTHTFFVFGSLSLSLVLSSTPHTFTLSTLIEYQLEISKETARSTFLLHVRTKQGKSIRIRDARDGYAPLARVGAIISAHQIARVNVQALFPKTRRRYDQKPSIICVPPRRRRISPEGNTTVLGATN